jgi:hypothetical protein
VVSAAVLLIIMAAASSVRVDDLVVRLRPGGHPGSDQRIAGRVVDETGAPLPGVGLTLTRPDGTPTNATTTTGARGDFSVTAVPGHYRLRILAPGLRLQRLDPQPGTNRWQVRLEVDEEAATVRVEVDRHDPDNPSAKERARMAFHGTKVTGLPVVSPTLAELQHDGLGARHPVAHQPIGALCIRSAHCDQQRGLTVCCAGDGELTDDFLANDPDGIRGTCRPVADCPGARKHRR